MCQIAVSGFRNKTRINEDKGQHNNYTNQSQSQTK